MDKKQALHPFTIDEVFVFIATDETGEGVPAFQSGDMMLPLFGADVARVESLKQIAAQISRQSGKAIKLVRFTKRRELATIDPLTGEWHSS